MEQTTLKKLKLTRRIVAVTLVLYTAVFLIINAGNLGIDDIRRCFADIKTGLSGNTEIDSVASASAGCAYKDGIATVSDTKLTVYGRGLAAYKTHTVNLSNPVLKTGGDYLLAFDRGGKNLYVADSFSVRLSKTFDETIINAGLSDDGRLWTATELYGGKAEVTVYNATFGEAFKWSSVREYFLTAVISDKNELTAICLNGSGGTTDTVIYVLDSAAGEEKYSFTVPDRIVLSACAKRDGTVELVTDKDVISVSDGEYKTVYTYSESGLKTVSQTSNYTLLSETENVSSGAYILTLLDYAGNVRSSTAVTGILDACLSDGGIEVLTAGSFRIFDFNGIELTVSDVSRTCSRMLCSSRTVFLLDGETYYRTDIKLR